MKIIACFKHELTLSEWEMLNWRNEYEIKTFGEIVMINATFDFYLKKISPETLVKFKDVGQFLKTDAPGVVHA